MFQINSERTGYIDGAYDLNAIYPTMANWSRNSNFLGPSKPKVKWELKLGFNNFFESPIINSEGTIYYGDKNGIFYAIDQNGEIKWTYFIGQQIRVPTIAADETIYFGTTGPVSASPKYVDQYRVHKLYALHSDGTLKCL